jgi:signal transduction histidine kinase
MQTFIYLCFGWLLVAMVAAVAFRLGRRGADAEKGRCGRHDGCAACRDRALTHVCARYPGPTILGATEGFARLVGRAGTDLSGLPLEAVLDLPSLPSEASALKQPMSACTARGSLRRPDGAAAPVLAAVTVEPRHGHPVLSIGVMDAAPVVAAEREARDARALQTGVAELAPFAVLVLTRDGNIVQANGAASHLFGLPHQSLVGRPFARAVETAAAEPAGADRFLVRAWQEKAAALTVNLHHPGRRRQPTEFLARTFWELPEPVLLIFGRSLAHERRLEQQLTGMHRLSVLGKLTDGMAHDVNNVLASIFGRAQLLARRSVRPEMREHLQLIERAAADGAHIVRRTLDLARGRREAAGDDLVDLNAVAADAVAMCQSRMRHPGATIQADLRLARTAPVRGDASELRELLVNLILNAIEAMPRGGILRVGTQRRAEAIHLVVADTGQGMDAAVQTRMFDLFFTTKGSRGTGLGLAMVRQIAARHRAQIEVDSAPGKGTTMRVVFPLEAAVAAPVQGVRSGEAAPAAISDSHPRSTIERSKALGRVLVIDDDEHLRRLVEEVLLGAGHQARTTGAPRQALVACARRELDCLLIDLELPGQDGRQVAAQARQLDPALALVMLSGSRSAAASETWSGPEASYPEPEISNPESEIQNPKSAPLFDFTLSKPFDLDQLLSRVSDAIALTAQRRSGSERSAVSEPQCSAASR